MAGGPSTPALAAAVSGAGGLGFLGAGYKTVDAVREDIAATRALTDRPFGVNVFALAPARPATRPRSRAYAARLSGEAERAGVELGEPRFEDDDFAAKMEALIAEPRRGRLVHVRRCRRARSSSGCTPRARRSGSP